MSDAIGAVRPVGTARRASAGLGRLSNLQVLRALAATFVVLLHAALQLEMSRGDARLVHVFNVHLGALGVALFFAMSGFLMAHLVRSTECHTFLVHRVIRIYPIFLIVVLTYSLVGPLFGLDVTRDGLALTLAPTGKRSYALGIEWTLLYETTFYVALFLISAAGWARRIEAIAAGWLVLIAGATLTGHEAAAATHFPRLHHLFFADVNVAFAAGLLVPWALGRGWLPARLCLLAGPVSLALVWVEVAQYRWWLSLASVLMVAGAVQVRQVSASGAFGRLAVRFGDWSYALYLVHIPMIFVVFRLAPASASAALVFLAATGASFAVAALAGRIDVGLYRRLRGRVDRASPRSIAVAAWCFAVGYLGIAAVTAVQVEREEAATARVRALLSGLPPGSFAGAARLAQAVEGAGLRASPDLVGRLERVERLATGQLLAVGWAVDVARPSAPVFLALACGERVVTIARPQRFRPDVATMLARDELRRYRLGFTAGIEPGACPAASSLLPVFVDGKGGLLPGPEVRIGSGGGP